MNCPSSAQRHRGDAAALEAGTVTIARAAGTFTYPARFQLVASMNPCPCGYRGTRSAECRCDDAMVAKYVSKLSGPLLDRIDLQIEMARVPFDEMARYDGGETSLRIRERVIAARELSRSIRRDEMIVQRRDSRKRDASLLRARRACNARARASGRRSGSSRHARSIGSRASPERSPISPNRGDPRRARRGGDQVSQPRALGAQQRSAKHHSMSVDRAYAELKHSPRLGPQRLDYFGTRRHKRRVKPFGIVHFKIGKV